MWGNLDHAIHEATGFQIVRRQWINHDINTILRFYRGSEDQPPVEQDPIEAFHKYDSVPVELLQYGHLMVKLLLMGPSLVTIWRGNNVIPTLLSIKGKTQPTEAADGSIRGSFWCDNGVCSGGQTNRHVTETLFRHVWQGGADAGDAARLQAVTAQLAPRRAPDSPEVKAELRAATDAAIAAGVVGVPTMAVDGRFFWGLDALPMLRDYLTGAPWFAGPDWDQAAALPVGVQRSRRTA